MATLWHKYLYHHTISNAEKRMKIVPVIMAGGSGTRLWPLSRASYPKQFLAFNSDTDTLFQLTLKRLQVLNV
ncbi:MAG: sugar phosphate nucleotidyltransferase, partial [Venatoribacter sp.]